MDSPRKDIHLFLTGDQFDDLISALENHRDSFQKMASEARNGFGLLDTSYWTQRVSEVEQLISAVHRLAQGASPETVNHELQQQAAKNPHRESDTDTDPAPDTED